MASSCVSSLIITSSFTYLAYSHTYITRALFNDDYLHAACKYLYLYFLDGFTFLLLANTYNYGQNISEFDSTKKCSYLNLNCCGTRI